MSKCLPLVQMFTFVAPDKTVLPLLLYLFFRVSWLADEMLSFGEDLCYMIFVVLICALRPWDGRL